jgi:NADH-quinone oxidoreductase subunit J
MMLDIDFVELKQGFTRFLPLGSAVGVCLIAMFVLVINTRLAINIDPANLGSPTPSLDIANNAEAIGLVIYTKYLLFFQLAGLVLFVAMIGAIVLTLHHRDNVKRQNVTKQVGRLRAEGVELTNPKSGAGVEL